MTDIPRTTARLARRALVAAALLGAAACKNALDVERPTVITGDNVGKDSLIVAAMVAGAEGPFRTAYATTAVHGASQTDEALFSHSWSPWNQYDDRNVTSDGGAYDGITYPQLQQARAAGARMVDLIHSALGADADHNAGFARANAYAGYSHILIADHLCAIPINGSAPQTPDAVRDTAIRYFQEAVRVGRAANAPEIVNLANVGLARAYLGKGDKANAIVYAKKVPASFAAWVRYTADPEFGNWTIYNLYNRVSGLRSPSEFNLGYDPAAFATVNDLRVPFEKDSLHKMFELRGNRYSYVPYTPESFSGWTPGDKQRMQPDASIRFASGLEARYMIAEAGGMSAAEERAFVNERRAVGGIGTFGGTDAGLFDELLQQRKMDFMLAGFRMPDLIRYKRFYGKDLWPKGKMGGWVTGDYTQNYGSTECWPIGASERNANPNIPN
jgi:starch-binding outer membrane protein, SusD/RagB family